MSISPSTLLALQKAGEGLHTAREAFAQEVQSNAGRVVGIVASEPFSSEADRAYAQLRAVARMAHELQSIEEQLKTMYGASGGNNAARDASHCCVAGPWKALSCSSRRGRPGRSRRRDRQARAAPAVTQGQTAAKAGEGNSKPASTLEFKRRKGLGAPAKGIGPPQLGDFDPGDHCPRGGNPSGFCRPGDEEAGCR
jgi:hypothetical protein